MGELQKVLIVCDDVFFTDIMCIIFKKINYETEIVDNPKDAVEKIEKINFHVVVIGSNKGSVVKSKLAEILYNKAKVKPIAVLIFKDPGEIVPEDSYIISFLKPNFHTQIIKTLERLGLEAKLKIKTSNFKAEDFVKSATFTTTQIDAFFKNLKGNQKFIIKANSDSIIGFTMGTDLYILESTFADPYSIFEYLNIEVAIEPLNISEFLSLPIDSKTFKINLRDFIIKAVEKINNKDILDKIIPLGNYTINIKAPKYIISQIELIAKNIAMDETINGKTIDELTDNKNDIEKLKAVACMYLLNMVEFEEVKKSQKYDVKIKKSFLRKIIDKIRGL
ncbi:response regulator [Hippea jasoniae]|uniref:response regulator n=1 Tax=Hippea jasoniae TaxID=944479 RepID=UPI00055436C8|nr:response regulator [Hippea jasoniae]